jgi:hypothetical protein
MKLRTVPTSLLQLLAHASAQGAAVNLSDLTVTFPSSDALCAAWSDAHESHVTEWGFTLLRPASPYGAEAARRAELTATGAARWL